MSWLMAAFYDRTMKKTEAACLEGWRKELLQRAHGRVLEIGVGTGANLQHYPRTIRELVLLEPDAHMRRKLEAKLDRMGHLARSEISTGSAAALPFNDDAFDTVVSTLVLCSVPDLQATLGEIRRVLRPGGRFIFLEHVAAETGSKRVRWQKRAEPVWKHLAGNCHLTRQTEEAIAAAGLTPIELAREEMVPAVPLVRPTIRGYAVKAAPP